jgi:hypothetical protein
VALKSFHRKDTKNCLTITESAVVQRIRRKLKTTPYMLRKARGERQLDEAGRYYVIDTNLNTDHLLHVNIEAYARELGVLEAHESVAESKIVGRSQCRMLTPGTAPDRKHRWNSPRRSSRPIGGCSLQNRQRR